MQCDEYRYSVDVSNKNLVNNKTLWLFYMNCRNFIIIEPSVSGQKVSGQKSV